MINTRRMDVEAPPEYVAAIRKVLKTKWNRKRCTFYVTEAQQLTGKLQHLAATLPWLRYLLPQLYTSIAAALGANNVHLIKTSADYRQMLKDIKSEEILAHHRTYAQSETAKQKTQHS